MAIMATQSYFVPIIGLESFPYALWFPDPDGRFVTAVIRLLRCLA